MTSSSNMTSPRRPLHYGDIIYLSTKAGSIGAFYPFSSLNNLLLLDHGSSLESAQAMWCTFRILPPYHFKDQAALQKEFKHPKKHWPKISKLEKDVENENVDNKKRFVRSLSRTVRYQQDIQLEHVATRRFMGHTPSRTSSTEDRNFPCCLEEIPSNKTIFKMSPVLPGYAAGDVVHSCDIVNIFTDPDGFVRDSFLPLSTENSFYPSLPEINIGPVNEGFKVSLHYQMIDCDESKISSWNEVDIEEMLNPLRLMGTNLIQLTRSGTNLRFVLDNKASTTTNLALKDIPIPKEKHHCTAVETFWVLEHDTTDGAFRGDVITDGTPVRLRHFVTGEYAKLPGNGAHIRVQAALESGGKTDQVYKTGAHVKLATDKGYIGLGSSDTAAVVSKLEFNFNDTVTLRKVETAGRTSAMRILGLKLLLSTISTKDKHDFKVTVANYKIIIMALNDSEQLLGTRKETAEDFISFGIVDILFELAKLYSTSKVKINEVILCLDAICKLLNKISRVKPFVCFDKRTSELLSLLIVDDLKIGIKCHDSDDSDQGDVIQDGDQGDMIQTDLTPTVVSPLNSLLSNCPFLLSSIFEERVVKLVAAFENTSDRVKKRELAKIMCSLCRIRGKTVPVNQKIISDLLFKNNSRSGALLKHIIKDNDIFYEGTSLTEIKPNSDLYDCLLSQLQLYESLLYGRVVNSQIKDKLVDQHNMFTLAECVKVMKNKQVDENVRGWYIQIMIAAYIDTGFTDTKIIPQMLTFQYDENIVNRGTGKPPDKTEDLYQSVLKELESFLTRNAKCTVNDHDSRRKNMYRYHMMRLLEYMFRARRINYENANMFIVPLIAFLDGTNDRYEDKKTVTSNPENEKSFRKIFRFKPLEINQQLFDIKKRALRVLYYAYESALFDYWTYVMKEVYSTVKYYHKNEKAWLDQIGNFLGKFDMHLSFHEVIIKASDPTRKFDVTSKEEVDARNTLKQMLMDEYKKIELFSQMHEVIRVLVDTMRYEDNSLNERAMKLLVMIRSPTNRLLELLPKSAITIKPTPEFNKRQKIVENVMSFFKTARDELSLESREKICTVLESLEQSLRDKDQAVNKARQKLLYDMDVVIELISLLVEPMSSLITRPIESSELKSVAESVDKMKSRAFFLLQLLISNLPAAQNYVMKHFIELISIQAYHKGAGNLPNSELEVSRVLALNEVFTANTNLSIKVNDDILQAIFDKLLTLVNAKSLEELTLNSRATYRYLEMLENILDLEESDQVLYKLQADVLKFIRGHWEQLKGSIITDDGTYISLNLLNCCNSPGSEVDLEGKNWKGLYFVKMLSLMATCASGSLKSSLTICKKLIPYQDLKDLIEKCSTDVVYLKCLLKFFMNVYVKSSGQLKKAALVLDVLQYTATGGRLIKALYDTILDGDAPTQLNNLSSIRYFEISLKRLNEDDTAFIDHLDCVFNSVLPLVAEVFITAPVVLLNENGGPKIAEQLSANMRLLLKATSPFLNKENFNMLLSAIEAVNRYKPERGNDLKVTFEGETWIVNACGTCSEPIKEAEQTTTTTTTAQNEDNPLKKVMELKRERSMQAQEVTMQEQNRVNRMFQDVIKIIRTAVKSDVPDQFFSKSEELEILGKTILGTLEEESKSGQQTLPEVVFKGPTNVISGAKDLVMDQLLTRSVPAILKYKDDELWSLLKRVFSWLRKDRQKNEFIVKQFLNSITLQLDHLHTSSASTNDAEEEEEDIGNVIVSRLLNIGFVEMLCSLISRNISAQPAITCLCSLLQFAGAQKQMLQVCMSNEEPIFEWVWDQINTAVSGYIQFNMARNVMLSAARPIIDIDTATPHMRLAVQFIGRLSNKTSKIQDYLRNQHNKIVSHNFLTALLNLLRTIPKHDLIEASSDYCQIRMKEHNKMIEDTLVALGDMLSTNTTAKEYAIEMGIIESIDRLLEDISSLEVDSSAENISSLDSSGDGDNIKPRLSTVSVEDVLRIRINCYDVLVTLLEYDQKLLDVGEKISDVMSVNDLKFSVVNQLELLNQNSSPELRELSSRAAFKGYNVLKKIEGMEGFSAKDKSVPDIDKTIAKDVTIKSVEVIWNNSLEKLYFPIQSGHEDLIRRKVKDQMLWGLSRKTLTDKNVDFLGWSGEIIKDMKNMYNLKQIPIVKELVGLEFLWDWLVLLLAIVIQLWLLVDLEDFGMRTSGDKTCGEGSLTNMIEIKNFPADNNSTSVCVSKVFSKAQDILGAVHLISTILLAATYATTNWHRFDHPTFNWRALIWGQRSEQANAHKHTKHRMKIDITSFYNFWLLIMISCSALGILFHGQLYCVHLMHIVAMFDLLTRVIRGATANRDQLLVIIPFAVFIIYIYSMIYFTFTRSMFDNDKMEYCNTLAQCFSTAIRYSMRNSNGGHNYSWTDKKAFTDMWIRIAIDVSFWLFYTIIGLKVVTALVLDGFTSQKKLRETSLEDMDGVCSICGLTKDEFSGKGIVWDTHKQEHYLWSYVNLFYYLTKNKRSSKLSAIEDEVLDKFERGDISFLPRKTSLSWERAIKEREDMLRKERIF